MVLPPSWNRNNTSGVEAALSFSRVALSQRRDMTGDGDGDLYGAMTSAVH